MTRLLLDIKRDVARAEAVVKKGVEAAVMEAAEAAAARVYTVMLAPDSRAAA